MVEIYLIRHGETKWSLSGHHTGLTDIPLTDNGIAQAKALQSAISKVPFKLVYCSPLQRAKQTCEVCNLLDRAIINSDLVEWDYGDYEGLTTKQIHEIDPNWSVFTKDPKNGESFHHVQMRADRMISELQKLDGPVAVFSSGHFLRVLASRWCGFPTSYGRYLLLSTASISVLSIESDIQVIKHWNVLPY